MATTGILYTSLKTFQPQGMGGARNAAQSTQPALCICTLSHILHGHIWRWHPPWWHPSGICARGGIPPKEKQTEDGSHKSYSRRFMTGLATEFPDIHMRTAERIPGRFCWTMRWFQFYKWWRWWLFRRDTALSLEPSKSFLAAVPPKKRECVCKMAQSSHVPTSHRLNLGVWRLFLA